MKPETICQTAAIRISSNCSNRSNSTKKLTPNSALKSNPGRHLRHQTSPHKKLDNASQLLLLCAGLPTPHVRQRAPLCVGLPTPHFCHRSSNAPNHSSALPKSSSDIPNTSTRAQLEHFPGEPLLATPSRQTRCNFAPENTASNLSAALLVPGSWQLAPVSCPLSPDSCPLTPVSCPLSRLPPSTAYKQT
jgi:hypothetical protein